MNAGAIPDRIGKYRVERLLGSGGMGQVFLAVDPDIGRQVAIKQVTLSSDPQARERFVREAQTMGRLNHPNITTLLEYGVDAQAPYLVLELLSGEDLSQWLRRPHSLREQLQVMLDIALGIEAAHRAGVLHRDLKPDNVRVLADGRSKLLDFGIAQSGAGQLTASGYFVGTPEFVAPEVMAGTTHAVAADVYALGLLYYVILTGDNPLRGETIQATVARVVQRVPPPIGTRLIGVPTELATLITACVSKQPEQRPVSASAVVSVLQQCLRVVPAELFLRPVPGGDATAALGIPVTPVPTGLSRQGRENASAVSRRPWLWGSLAALLLLLLVGGFWWWPLVPPTPLEPVITVRAPDPLQSTAKPDLPAGEAAAVDRPASTAEQRQTEPPFTGEPAPIEAAPTVDQPMAKPAAESKAPDPAQPTVRTAIRPPAPASPKSVVLSDDPSSKPPVTVPPIEPIPTPPSESRPLTAEPVDPPTVALATPPVEPAAAPIALEILRVFPPVLKTGRSVTVRVEGQHLDAVTAVSVQSGGVVDPRFKVGALRHDGGSSLSFSLSVARGVPLGAYALLLTGERVRAKSFLLEISL